MSYSGKIIRIYTSDLSKGDNFLCTEDHGNNTVTLVSMTPGLESWLIPSYKLDEVHSYETLNVYYADLLGLLELKERLEKRSAEVWAMVDDPTLSMKAKGEYMYIAQNIDLNLQKVVDMYYPKCEFDTETTSSNGQPTMNCTIEASNKLTANYVGKIVFLSFPNCGLGRRGKCGIVIQQDATTLYVVDATCADMAASIMEVNFDDTSNVSILDSYDDDDFIKDFIERCEDVEEFTDDPFGMKMDAIDTVTACLRRVLYTNDMRHPKAAKPMTPTSGGPCCNACDF